VLWYFQSDGRCETAGKSIKVREWSAAHYEIT